MHLGLVPAPSLVRVYTHVNIHDLCLYGTHMKRQPSAVFFSNCQSQSMSESWYQFSGPNQLKNKTRQNKTENIRVHYS